MIAVLAVTPLIILLWAVAWLAGFCGVRLPKKSWTRLPVAVLAGGVILGTPVFQVYLLTTIVSKQFAQDIIIYVLVAEYIPAIVLSFYAGIREDRAMKRREVSEEFKPHSDSAVPSATSAIGRQETKVDLKANGVLQAEIGPGLTPYTYWFAGLVVVVGLVEIVGFQFLATTASHRPHQLHAVIELIRVLQGMSGLAMSYILALIFTEKIILTLSPEELQLRYTVLNISARKQSFTNHDIRNLRYAHWRSHGKNGTVGRSGIRFEAGSETHSIGKFMPEPQAKELITYMRRVYAFPAEREGAG